MYIVPKMHNIEFVSMYVCCGIFNIENSMVEFDVLYFVEYELNLLNVEMLTSKKGRKSYIESS